MAVEESNTMPHARVADDTPDLRPQNGAHAPPAAVPAVRAEPAEEAEPEDAGGGWGRLITQGAIVLVLLAVVAGAYFYFTRADHAPAAQQARGPGGPMPVAVLTVEPKDVPLTAEYLAQTEPSQIVPIRARVNGYLVGRDFEEGQKVEKDQVLFRIDPQPFDVALQQAQAGLSAAQARQDRAKQQSDRFTSLAEVQSAAQSELEGAQEEQKVAAAQVQTQQALIADAQLNLDYATIKSPIAGVIGQRQEDVGSYINGMAGSALLATVRQVDPIYVRFSVSEQDLLKWQRLEDSGAVNKVKTTDLEVTVVLSDGRTYPQKGKINYVDVAVDPSTGTAVTRATVPNPNGTLLPGQYVNVKVSGVNRVNAITVPQAAVIQNPGGTSVYVMADDGTAQSRPVTPGEWSGKDWVIEKGLKAGDKVIVDHLMQLSQMPPGAKVTPAAPSTQPATTEEPAGADATAQE